MPTESAPAAANEQAWIDEIQAMYRARVYGDVEPLLQCLERQGLQQAEARALVAKLARRQAVPAERDEGQDLQDYRIAVMVANRRGLLVREGRSVKRAFDLVAIELDLAGEGVHPKTVKRAWNRIRELYHPAIFDGYYRQGVDGFRIQI